MVQRKVLNKLGIQDDHAKSSEKRFSNMKLYSSSSSSSQQHQDGKNSRCADMKKKRMKKSRSIKLSHLEALQSSPPSSRRCSSPSPLHVPTTTAASAYASPQKKLQPLARATTEGSPNYMKPTSSSHAKKELFPASLRNTRRSGSDFKNLARKSNGNSKASGASRTKSLSLARSLTKTTSFKASRANCPRKSTRATCSSTLKDSNFPAYLVLNHGGTESEGTSVMNVCPYTYCSLNGHHHRAALPPLKTFVKARRNLLKIQKSARVKAIGPRRSKDSEIEQDCYAFDAKALFDETGVDFFIEIYATEEREAEPTGSDEMGKIDFGEDIEEIGLEKGSEKSTDDVEDADERNQPRWSSHEEMSMGSYRGDDSYDGESMKDIEMEDYDSEATEMECVEERRICGLGHEEDDVDSSVFSEIESLSESSHDFSVTWLDEDVPAEETLIVANSEESEVFGEQHGVISSNDMGCDQSFPTELVAFEDYAENEETRNLGESDKTGGEDSFSIEESSDEENQVQEPELLEKDEGRANETFHNTSCANGEERNDSMTCKSVIRQKRRADDDDDDDEMRRFNPKEPNFLPYVPGPEPEKVDLRHQTMDEAKDAEQWMLDCALRQVVTKLAPARKKKVALLVEAFETIMPIPKCESRHMRRNNSAFPYAGLVQPCS